MKLSRKIVAAVENITPFLASEELADFRKIKRGNHPSIVKVLELISAYDLYGNINEQFSRLICSYIKMFRFQVMIENKEDEADGLPHLIYVAREKRPKCSHHFKAGAMNVLVKHKHN